MARSADGTRVPGDADAGKAGVIRNAFIFSTLDDSEIEELSAISVSRHLAAGEFVFFEGDPPDSFFIVAEGQIKVVKQAASGKDFILAFFEAGEIFGEVAVFEDKPYPASAQAAVDTRVVAVPRDEFVDFLSHRPRVAMRIIDVLGGRLREAQARLKDLAVEKVEQRLAAILLMLAERLGPTLPFTRQDIAEMTGTTTETAIRVMSRFKESRIIRTSRGKTIIIDAEKLRLLAEGRPGVR